MSLNLQKKMSWFDALAWSVLICGSLALVLAAVNHVGLLGNQLTIAAVPVVLAFAYITIKNLEYGLYILIFELILGGAGGRWFEFSDAISIRIVFLAIVGVVWIFYLLKGKASFAKIKKSGLAWLALLLAIGFPVIFGGIGLLNGNSPHHIFADSNGLIFYFLLIILISTLFSKAKLKRFVKVYLAALIINGIFWTVIFILNIFDVIGIWDISILIRELNMGGVAGILVNGVYRLQPGNGIFFEIGLALVLAYLLLRPRLAHKFWWIATATMFIFIISATYTRGYWLAAVIALGVILIFASSWKRRLQTAAYLLMGFAGAFLIAYLGFQFNLYDYYYFRTLSVKNTATIDYSHIDEDRKLTGAPLNLAYEFNRLYRESQETAGSSELQLADPASVSFRKLQAQILWQEIKKSPIIGSGFGYYIEELGNYSFELAYLDMILKFGFLGFAVWIFFLILLAKKTIQILRANPPPYYRAVTVGFGAALLGVLFTGSTNPYLLASFGISHIVFTAYVLETIDRKLKRGAIKTLVPKDGK